MRWLILLAVLVFIFAQITRLRPSSRDQQLQSLRNAAARAGLTVRFWTLRNSGYTQRKLPESGYIYQLPWTPNQKMPIPMHWAVWIDSTGEMVRLAGTVPDLAQQWLLSFREKFPDAWALLECSDVGLGLLWQERGNPDSVQNIADALDLLRKNLDALPG